MAQEDITDQDVQDVQDSQNQGGVVYDHRKQSGETWSEQRGAMTWTALMSMIALMGGLFFVPDPVRLHTLGDISQWYFMTMGSIVVAFFGVKALFNYRK